MRDVQAQRSRVQADSKDIENEIRRYESLIETLNREIGDKDSTGKYKRRTQNEKKAKVPITSDGTI